ncbi:hypothetical protein GCM10017653_38210 [Ancylobacter defluvii]|uniref:Uncharacterized protein n=1 Tax=Ancylobacter defluvii TaxID=1282440 RepID=A0A9W6NCM4_9HYPH|nr:hypothetical protein [Ancylobacter defluvii]MBS7586469.1 hypothetical protein [Ancylobacter defluvii]GLK85751.1 hypothetical protein GCM10017653_38210 [Ancylobacter defluvii]
MHGGSAVRATTHADIARLGTRFLVFPQPSFIPGYERPETVWISTPLGGVTAGPADDRMYVVDPVGMKPPYQSPYLPPYTGRAYPAVMPGPDGHFDRLPIGTREFQAAHVFACVRRVLDICESYWGEEIPWFFQPTYERLEIVPQLDWDNAQSGFGFLELGEERVRSDPRPFALNFDAVAHEVGHLVLFGAMGVPRREPPRDYFAYHEAVSDVIALLGLLHFDTALDLILRRTRGNLLLTNEFDRFAELSDEKEVRRFNHSLKMTDVGREVHDLSKPFAGALFDTLIEIYQLLLFERGLSDLDPRTFWNLRSELPEERLEQELSASLIDYERRHFAAKAVLEEARDVLGSTLLGSWRLLDPAQLTYADAAEALIRTADNGSARRFADRFEACLAWRGVLLAPGQMQWLSRP